METLTAQIGKLFDRYEDEAEAAYVEWLGGKKALERIKKDGGWHFDFGIPTNFGFKAQFTREGAESYDMVVHALDGIHGFIGNVPVTAKSAVGLRAVLLLGKQQSA